MLGYDYRWNNDELVSHLSVSVTQALRVTVRVAACPLEFSLISKWLHSSRLFRICPRSKFFPDIYSGIYYFFPLFTALLVSFSSRIWQISFHDCRTSQMLHLVSHRAQFWDLYCSCCTLTTSTKTFNRVSAYLQMIALYIAKSILTSIIKFFRQI